MSFARVKLWLTRIAHVPSRLGWFRVGDDAGLAVGLAAAMVLDPALGEGRGPGA
ncbi:MAG: hypothetical protein ACRDG6_10230 [Candidatus Limnocylindria bacterium]